jgi:hypothetical protein
MTFCAATGGLILYARVAGRGEALFFVCLISTGQRNTCSKSISGRFKIQGLSGALV